MQERLQFILCLKWKETQREVWLIHFKQTLKLTSFMGEREWACLRMPSFCRLKAANYWFFLVEKLSGTSSGMIGNQKTLQMNTAFPLLFISLYHCCLPGKINRYHTRNQRRRLPGHSKVGKKKKKNAILVQKRNNKNIIMIKRKPANFRRTTRY